MNIDRILGVGAVLMAMPVGWASWGFGVGSPKSPGAGFWPLSIAVLMIGLGLVLILRPSPASRASATTEARWGKLGLTLATVAFYIIALEPLGYLPTTALMLVAQLRWVENRSWRSTIVIALLAAVLSFLLFRVLLKVTLPGGLIPLPKGW